jgi:hypothetical protein
MEAPYRRQTSITPGSTVSAVVTSQWDCQAYERHQFFPVGKAGTIDALMPDDTWAQVAASAPDGALTVVTGSYSGLRFVPDGAGAYTVHVVACGWLALR